MRFDSVTLLVKGSNNQSINNDDHIFCDSEKKEFYTANRLVSKCHQVINYLCNKIIKLEEKLPNLFRSTKIISIAKSYLNRHMPANDILSTEYNIPNNSNNLLTGKTLKEFISKNELTEDNTPHEIGVLLLTFDKHDANSFHLHICDLIKKNASIHHIQHDLNLIDQDNKTKFLNSQYDGRFLLTNALFEINRKIGEKGEITQYQKDIINLLIEHGANIRGVDSSSQSVISRAINPYLHKNLILFLIDIAPTDSFSLQENESVSVLYTAIVKVASGENNAKYVVILEKILDKGVDLDLPITCNGDKFDKQFVDKLLSKNKQVSYIEKFAGLCLNLAKNLSSPY